jgi:hypothetical protein
MKQVLVGVPFLVAGIWLASKVAGTVDGEVRLIDIVALAIGSNGVSYLLLARRVGKLEWERGVVYYWQRQPAIENFEHTSVYAVLLHAVVW